MPDQQPQEPVTAKDVGISFGAMLLIGLAALAIGERLTTGYWPWAGWGAEEIQIGGKEWKRHMKRRRKERN